jgi:hypothetical protein
LPNLAKTCQNLPKLAKTCQNLPKHAKTCQNLPNRAKPCCWKNNVSMSAFDLPRELVPFHCYSG